MSLLPDNDKLRKNLPIFAYITRYCPKALREMTKVSVVNNVRYNPDREPADINWARDKSKDQLGSGFRHMLEHAVDGKEFEAVDPVIAEKTGITRVYILAENAWRAVAALELKIEEVEAREAGDIERAEKLARELQRTMQEMYGSATGNFDRDGAEIVKHDFFKPLGEGPLSYGGTD